MKTLYKIITIAIICFAMIGTASASMDHFNTPAPSGVDHHYEKGILTIPIDFIQKPETQTALRAWQYEDIEITAVI